MVKIACAPHATTEKLETNPCVELGVKLAVESRSSLVLNVDITVQNGEHNPKAELIQQQIHRGTHVEQPLNPTRMNNFR